MLGLLIGLHLGLRGPWPLPPLPGLLPLLLGEGGGALLLEGGGRLLRES